MKKYKFQIVAIIVSLLSYAGCKKSDLTLTDPNNVVITNFYKSDLDALIGLAGVFDAYQSNNLMGKRYREFDHVTDNAYTFNGQGWQEIEGSVQTPSNNIVTAFWPAYYTVVSRANNVISSVSKMSSGSISDTNKARIIAEATFLRDYAYFDLTALWGDVPFYTEPLDPFSDPKGKTAKTEIFSIMIAELKNKVIPNLPKTLTASEKGRIPQGAALALLGKCYLYQKDYGNAASTFKLIIDSKIYKLYPNYAELFTEKGEFSSESLFEINFTGNSIDDGETFSSRIDTNAALQVPTIFWLPIASLVNSYLCKDGKPIATSTLYGTRSTFYNTTLPYSNRDPRLSATVYTNADKTNSGRAVWRYTNVNSFAVKKYSTLSNVQYINNGPQNYYVIRYADVLLMYAEAQNENVGTDRSVYDAVKEIRTRVGMPEYPAGLTQLQMQSYIRDERRWEFALEHQRYFDMQRWGITGPLVIAAGNKKQYTSPKDLLWPYPINEVDRNSLLKAQGQNIGY